MSAARPPGGGAGRSVSDAFPPCKPPPGRCPISSASLHNSYGTGILDLDSVTCKPGLRVAERITNRSPSDDSALMREPRSDEQAVTDDGAGWSGQGEWRSPAGLACRRSGHSRE